MDGMVENYAMEVIGDFNFVKNTGTDFKTYQQAYRIFLDLFKKYYVEYGDKMDIAEADIRNARAKRFETDEYWSIWRKHGEVVAFIEAFFHKQNGFNMLPRIFDKYPNEIPNFQSSKAFLKRFENDKELVKLFEDCDIKRMRNEMAKSIWNGVKKLDVEHGGVVPRERWKLLQFDGLGRKISNMLLNLAFDLPEIGIDVRVFRAACDLKFIPFKPEQFASDSVKFEAELILRRSIPQVFFLDADYLLFMHGGGVNVHSPKPKKKPQK
jgi:endonuclease III